VPVFLVVLRNEFRTQDPRVMNLTEDTACVAV